MTLSPIVLCLNSGSSSLKCALYQLDDGQETLLATGAVEDIGRSGTRVWFRGPHSIILTDTLDNIPDHQTAVQTVFTTLEQLQLPRPRAVGHRVVHGGPAHVAPERVTPSLIAALRQLVAFAPLHLPVEIVGIEAVTAHFPDLPQVVCFDTAFHRRMPEIAQRFALPRSLWDQGIRRYGFHGLSYEYIVETLGTPVPSRVIIAHLGNGASMAAIRDGQPLDTTMGLTPTGGFMMGTRSGDLDPGLLLHLMQEHRYDTQRLEHLVNHEAGLLGVSGGSADMKTLLEIRDHDPAAAQAVDMFCYQVRKHLGALTAVLGSLDTVVFTGGIGERAVPVRWEICAPLAYLGIHLDPQRNAAHADLISVADSLCTVRVIPTNEDLTIARHTRVLVFPQECTT